MMRIMVENEDKCKRADSRIFCYTFKMLGCNKECLLEIPVDIPYTGSVSELTNRLINNFELPIYLENDLNETLSNFIYEETILYQDSLALTAIKKASKHEIDVEDIIRKYEKLYKEETIEYGEKRGTSDSELFSSVYHKLVHSGPALQTMLQVEQSYSLAMEQILNQKEEQISSLTLKQTQEMDKALAQVSIHNNEQEINTLLIKHIEEQSLMQGRWNSEVDTLKDSQRKEYRDWLMKMLEDHQTNSTLPNSPLSSISPPIDLSIMDNERRSNYVSTLEESFTIHLGSQMKQMHNIRILSADILDFCKVKLQTERSCFDPSPQRLQTALGLYSNDLCALVLLEDSNDLSCSSDLSKEFVSICENSTEFHFPTVSEQLEGLKFDIKEAISWRHSNQHSDNLTCYEQQTRRTSSKHLQPGDMYITRHSNLSSVHIVFHMIYDDSLKSNDINSRHPTILGLRNILKTACSNDITTLTIPVLLMHEMTEEMTVAWCTKRAELVFKCVKGFMIEMATWGGADLKNLQFLVPKGISEEVFTSLATMLPSIFRVSNPLVLKTTATPTTPKNKLLK